MITNSNYICIIYIKGKQVFIVHFKFLLSLLDAVSKTRSFALGS